MNEWFGIRCYFDPAGIDEPHCFGDSLVGFDLTTLVCLYVGFIVAVIALNLFLNLGIGGSHHDKTISRDE